MNDYTTYLQKRDYTETTIRSYTEQAQSFIKWCNRNHTTAIEIDYKDCLKYIRYLQRKNTTKKTVNHRLGRVKTYLNYLVEENFKSENPIENTTVKGSKRHINYNLLEADELEDLYYSYNTENIKDQYHRLTAKRDRIIVGLMVYQGLCTTNLKALEVEHVQVYKGKIYVPSHKKMNARELELKPWQVIELLEYIKEIREEIKERRNIESERLLIPNNDRLGNTIGNIIKKLKTTNHKAENINQIRASVITNWLGQYNLRKVQYLAGHRYISSTERYLQDDLENLHEIVNNFHPIS
jgi:site-specific recombinase XerD